MQLLGSPHVIEVADTGTKIYSSKMVDVGQRKMYTIIQQMLKVKKVWTRVHRIKSYAIYAIKSNTSHQTMHTVQS